MVPKAEAEPVYIEERQRVAPIFLNTHKPKLKSLLHPSLINNAFYMSQLLGHSRSN
jgi:hypothetical protein